MEDQLKTFHKSADGLVMKQMNSSTGSITAVISSIGNKDVVNDVMLPGAFDKFIKNFNEGDNVLPMFLQHSQTNIVGEWNKIYQKGDEIIADGQIYTDTNSGHDANAFVQKGLIGSTSIGFRAKNYEPNDAGGLDFGEVELFETSLVINPANKRAQILSAKNEDGVIDIRSTEKVLRDAGLSRSEAKMVLAGGVKSLIEAQREVVIREDTKMETVNKLQQILGGRND